MYSYIFMPFFLQVSAADDRRHNAAHLSQWISLPDMISKAKARCPEGTPIPSKSLVRLQFMPKNRNSHTAASFKQRFAVEYKIQVFYFIKNMFLNICTRIHTCIVRV